MVSFSFNDSILDEVDRLQESLGFSSRSEVVRAGIQNIINEKRQDKAGQMHPLLLITHHERFDEEITKMRHQYEELVTTHLHNKIDNERCLEFFVLNGDAAKVKKMCKRFAASKAMRNVKLVSL
ncbi:MAG: CopG family ribbon-helix-helix protein [Nitrososphaera sp.]